MHEYAIVKYIYSKIENFFRRRMHVVSCAYSGDIMLNQGLNPDKTRNGTEKPLLNQSF